MVIVKIERPITENDIKELCRFVEAQERDAFPVGSKIECDGEFSKLDITIEDTDKIVLH